MVVQPGDLWTLTTVNTMTKGTVAVPPPPPGPFPTDPYSDDFELCAQFQEAAYFTDQVRVIFHLTNNLDVSHQYLACLKQTGVWECQPNGSSTVMRQMASAHPVAWRPDEQRPFTVFAADAGWTEADMNIDASLRASGDVVLFGVRANPNNCCGRVITGEDLMPGAWLSLNATGSWVLYNAIANVSTSMGVLAQGQSSIAPTIGSWHSYRLSVIDDHVSAEIDGVSLFSGLDVQGVVPPSGFVGFGTGSWGQYVEFDNFRVIGNATNSVQ